MKPFPLVISIGVILCATPVAAQSQFTWQLQPYCNRVVLTLNSQGGGFSFIGIDDQCGSTSAVGDVTGTAEVQGATAIIRLHIVAEGQKDLHLTATIGNVLANLTGTWSDSGGLSGNFVFGSNTGGPLRPTPALPQQRISAACAADSAIRAINADGTVVCEADDQGAIPPGGITTALIGNGAVTTAKIASGAITNVQIANNTIGVAQINTAEVQPRLTAGTGIDLAGSTVSFNGQIGASTEVVRRGLSGTLGQANGWQPDAVAGLWLESRTSSNNASNDSGGFFVNGNSAAIWSAGESTRTVRNGSTSVGFVLLNIYDEDILSAGTAPQPDFIFGSTRSSRAIDTWTGGHLTAGGAWTNASDRSRKRHIVAFDGQDALARLRRLPVYQWGYIAEADGVRHVGPMAQDFHAAFGLNGDDDTHIATVDADGVLMASVVAVADQSDALRAENVRLREQISGLEARLARLERLLTGRER